MVKKKAPNCPVCLSHNQQTKLVLKQINLEEAVYLCKNSSCKYPEGHSWIIIPRTFDEMINEMQMRRERKQKCEIKMLDKICANTSCDTSAIMMELNECGGGGDNTTALEDQFNIDALIEDELVKLNDTNAVQVEHSFNFSEFDSSWVDEVTMTEKQTGDNDKNQGIVILENILLSQP